MIVSNIEDLVSADSNECSNIMINIDGVSNSEFINFYDLCLSKLRIGGKLCLVGTSLSMFARFVINSKEDIRTLQQRVESSKCFHELVNVESLMRRDLSIENVWYDGMNFNIVGVRN